MPTLILNFPEGETTALAVAGDIVTLGRASHNDLCLSERHVSSVHAEFRRRPDGAYELIDLGSLNGTYVNGVRITERFGLHEGDRIVFGIIEGKFLHTRPELASSDDRQLTRGLEIDFLRAAEAIRRNPDLAQAAVELQPQINGVNGRPAEPAGPPSPLPMVRPAPIPVPAPPLPAPLRNPTIQLVSLSRGGRPRQVVVEAPDSGSMLPPAAGGVSAAPDSFLPAEAPPAGRSPFSVAPPENGNGASLSRMPPPAPANGYVPPARRTPWRTLLSPKDRASQDDLG